VRLYSSHLLGLGAFARSVLFRRNVSILCKGRIPVLFRRSVARRTHIMGSIDCVTGDVEAISMLTEAKTGKAIASTTYALKCTPAQRMFSYRASRQCFALRVRWSLPA
jgi:hypothetical protein